MLAGEAVVAIWNDVVPEGLAAFHAWHIGEHMAERVGIPGFRRGRRYAADGRPASFFTLYEVESLAVLSGAAYTARLNAPTPATEANIPNFRNTTRALAAVAQSAGAGAGGALLTLRFDADDTARERLASLARDVLAMPRIIAAHLCRTDAAASGIVTKEKQGRTTLAAPPGWVLLVEAADTAALAACLPDAALAQAGAEASVMRGLYRLEQMMSAPITPHPPGSVSVA